MLKVYPRQKSISFNPTNCYYDKKFQWSYISEANVDFVIIAQGKYSNTTFAAFAMCCGIDNDDAYNSRPIYGMT
jgi:hypothetical protein